MLWKVTHAVLGAISVFVKNVWVFVREAKCCESVYDSVHTEVLVCPQPRLTDIQ